MEYSDSGKDTSPVPKGPVKRVNLNRPLYSTSEQSYNDQGSQVIQSTRTVLWERSEKFIGACVGEQLNWPRGLHCSGKGWGTGTQCRLPMDSREEGRRAGPVWLKVDFHIGSSPLGTRKLCCPEWNSTAKGTGVGGEDSTASLEQPKESGPFPSVHRAAGQGQAGI